MPATLPGPEGIIFGAGQHLPDGRVLENFDFYANKIPPSRSIANIPGHPNCVVRINDIDGENLRADAKDYYDDARTGIEHFNVMVDSGLQLPAQRFTVAKGIKGKRIDNRPVLCAITERIDGEVLITTDPRNQQLNRITVDGLSHYLLWIYRTEAPVFLWDNKPEQHTRTPEGQTKMHDVGLEFIPTINRWGKPSDRLCYNKILLNRWATAANIDPPKSLQQLNQNYHANCCQTAE